MTDRQKTSIIKPHYTIKTTGGKPGYVGATAHGVTAWYKQETVEEWIEKLTVDLAFWNELRSFVDEER